MRGAIAIARREIDERRVVLAAALVAGLLPFLGPLIPGVAAHDSAIARQALAGALAIGFGVAVALMLGATIVGRDLSENRLGFDLARPVGTGAVWAGRFAAALALVAAVVALVLAPASLVAVFAPPAAEQPALAILTGGAPAVVLGLLLLVPLAHVASVALRSRSRWLAVDFAVGIVVLGLVAAGATRMHGVFASGAAFGSLLAFAVLSIPPLWIASAVQFVRGRADAVHGHRAQSIALWSMLGVVALLHVAFAAWFVAADPRDLENPLPEGAPAGDWFAVSGQAWGRPGYTPAFVAHAETGRSVRLGAARRYGSDTLFSADGRRAAWLSFGTTQPVSIADLEAARPSVEPTRVVFPLLSPLTAALSPSGRRLAAVQGRQFSVHDLDEGRILVALRLEGEAAGWGAQAVTFLDEDRVRLYEVPDRLVIRELDVRSKELTSIRSEAVGGRVRLRWNGTHDRLLALVHTASEERFALLLDARTGEPLRRLLESTEGPIDGRFLDDGRIVLVELRPAATTRVLSFTPDGEPVGTVDLDSPSGAWLGGEPVPGAVLVEAWPQRASRGEERLWLVDLDDGAARPIEGGGAPVGMPWTFASGTAKPGNVGSRLIRRGAALWLLDPATLEARPVFR